MEKTLVVLKPDAVQRGIIGEIISRFEKVGLKIVAMKMVQPDEAHFHHHYETIGKVISRRGEDVYHRNAEFMMGGPVVAMVLEGINAVEQVRKMVGDTEPKTAQPGTIRGDYAHLTYDHVNEVSNSGLTNLIHASANYDESQPEISHWFSEEEMFDYRVVHEEFTQPKNKQK